MTRTVEADEMGKVGWDFTGHGRQGCQVGRARKKNRRKKLNKESLFCLLLSIISVLSYGKFLAFFF